MERKKINCYVYNLNICLKHGEYSYYLEDDKGKTYTLYKWAWKLLERNELTEKHIKNIIDYVKQNLKKIKEKKEFTFRMKKDLGIVLVIWIVGY